MNQFHNKHNEDDEQSLAAKFHQGQRKGHTPDEHQILQAYIRNQKQLKQMPLPAFDAQQLARRMTNEMNRKPSHHWMNLTKWIFIPQPALSFVVILLFLVGMGWGVWSYSYSAVQTIQTDSKAVMSWFDQVKLKQGFIIQTSADDSTIITLRDQSTIECTPNTILQIDYGATRQIALYAGSITIAAEKHPDWPMQVATPFGTVQVLGTTFTVKIVQ